MAREVFSGAPLDPDLLRPLREVFARGGYTDAGLMEIFGPVSLPTRAGGDLPHFLHLTRRGRPLDALLRLFLLGVPVDLDAARRALDPVSLETCTQWGLLEPTGGSAVATVKLLPFRDLLVAVDQPEIGETGARPDQVMGLTASTVSLANFTVRRPSRLTLDLGAGCGIQALLAARHSHQVCATDCNPRALDFARFNAAFNDCRNLCFLQGDAFDPVRARRFDLIVSNPPFAITPSRRYAYRDSGLDADSFCRKLVREAPALLDEGGFFQLTCDWIHPAGQDWKQRLSGWFEATGCDAWVLRTDTHDPASYAHMWIRDTEYGSPEEAARLYQEWVSYYERAGIEAIGTGLIALRRSGRAASWIRIEDAPEDVAGPIGDFIALGFELRDFLETASDQALLEAKLRLSPDARLDQHSACADGKWRTESARIRLARGLTYQGNIDPRIANLMARCDGRRPLQDLLVHMAVELGADPPRLIAECLPLARQLIERGFLLP